MNRRVISVVTICGILISSSALLADDNSRLLSRSEKKAYHACLYGSFIDDYCRFHAWGSSEAAFYECVIANGAARSPLRYPYWGWGANDACRAFAQSHAF
jgi:hypothetical protein